MLTMDEITNANEECDSMDSNFNPNSCPIGILNEKRIENLGDHVNMAIERLTEKVGEVKEDITTLSNNMDKKFESMDSRFATIDGKLESVDKKFDAMEDKFNNRVSDLKSKIPEMVDDEMDHKKGAAASAIIKWVFSGLIGGVLISVLISWTKMKLGL